MVTDLAVGAVDAGAPEVAAAVVAAVLATVDGCAQDAEHPVVNRTAIAIADTQLFIIKSRLLLPVDII
jgi:hypothetical protein